MKKTFFILLLVISACATTRNYENYLDGWVGKTSEELQKKWGPPNRVLTFADGIKGYEYRFRDTHNDERTRNRSIAGSNVGCKTTFFLEPGGTIHSWKWEGHDCVAK